MIEQIIFSPTTARLLYANGAIDRFDGKDLHQGWIELCTELGWGYGERTPAFEKYSDGWYGA